MEKQRNFWRYTEETWHRTEINDKWYRSRAQATTIYMYLEGR